MVYQDGRLTSPDFWLRVLPLAPWTCLFTCRMQLLAATRTWEPVIDSWCCTRSTAARRCAPERRKGGLFACSMRDRVGASPLLTPELRRPVPRLQVTRRRVRAPLPGVLERLPLDMGPLPRRTALHPWVPEQPLQVSGLSAGARSWGTRADPHGGATCAPRRLLRPPVVYAPPPQPQVVVVQQQPPPVVYSSGYGGYGVERGRRRGRHGGCWRLPRRHDTRGHAG